MQVLIFGSRSITSEHMLFSALDESRMEDHFTEVVGGEAEGADTLGKLWAVAKGLPYHPYPANWSYIPPNTPKHLVGYSRLHGQYYKLAGHIRNAQMVSHLVEAREHGEQVFALCLMKRGGTKGTMGMLGLLRNANIDIFCKEFDV